jgi:DNA-binding Xre family transcriptional regulator
MNSTEYILDLIKIKYKNIRKFSEAIGIPYSTIKSGLKRGVGGMAVETVIKMCRALEISAEELIETENLSTINEVWREGLYVKIEGLNEIGCKMLSAYADGLLTNNEYLTESLGEVKNHA